MVVSLSFCTLKKIKGRTFRLFFVLVLCVIALIFYLLLSRADTCPHNDHEHSISSSELEHVNSLVRKQLVKLDVLIAQRDGILKEIQKYLKNIDPLRRKSRSLSDMVLKHREELEQFRLRKKIPNTCPRLPPLRLPKDISMSKLSSSFKTDSKSRINCKLSSCFKLQKCPYGSSFLAHVYKHQNTRVMSNTTQELYTMLESLQSLTDVSAAPCIYIVIIDTLLQNSPKAIEIFLHTLKYWQGEGHNHIIINFAKGDLLATVDTGRAMIAQTTFGPRAPYRRDFDIVIPPLMSLRKSGPMWENSAPQLPANRKYMLSFVGNYGKPKKGSRNENTISVDDLKQLSSEAKDMLIQLSCQVDEEFSNYNDWQLCWSHNERAKVLKASTFALIIQFGDDQTMTLVRLMEALQYGSIPVIISDNVLLPLSDIIDWHRATITLYEAQFPQLNFVLRTISVNDLFHIRRQGRFLWETYFSTTKTVLQSIMAAIQTRLLMSGILARDTKLPSVFDDAGREPVFNFSNAELTSPRFSRNFTANTVYGRQRWNTYPGALLFYPSSPFVPVLPSSAAFLNSLDHIQPIGKGSGGDGREFKKALGGNHPYEQFTIVMLTYKREKLLVKSLARFAQLQYLSKVVIVWNSPRDPSSALTWPNIGVPIKVLRPKKNSLNNRFLPLDEIQTDAVLSLDDDVSLIHDEIIFGFRIWREARDRIVGFVGHNNAWDLKNGRWLYNFDSSCQISMVLTGAAFFHKYYSYLYTHVMPQAIRDKVDEYTNCEDIAMNFLVSHVTRKPPIKLTSRSTLTSFDSTLYKDKTSVYEKNECLNFFEKVFGYMPLVRTQFRAHSMLHRTPNMSRRVKKCFDKF